MADGSIYPTYSTVYLYRTTIVYTDTGKNLIDYEKMLPFVTGHEDRRKIEKKKSVSSRSLITRSVLGIFFSFFFANGRTDTFI